MLTLIVLTLIVLTLIVLTVMKIQTLKWKTVVLALSCALSCLLSLTLTAPARAAATRPQPLAVGATGHVSLAQNESKDYSVSLPKGSYQVLLDGKHPDGAPSYIVGKVMLLKPNGVIVNDRLTEIRSSVVGDREGAVINAPAPFVARFRLVNEHEDNADFWLTVVPTTSTKRVPFGWGAAVTPARIAADNGVGGEMAPYQVFYHSITLPKGKWSISLGLSHTKKEEEGDYLVAIVDLLDARGVTSRKGFFEVRDRGAQLRQEGILTVTKPTTYLLRVRGDLADETMNYDITISPAS